MHWNLNISFFAKSRWNPTETNILELYAIIMKTYSKFWNYFIIQDKNKTSMNLSRNSEIRWYNQYICMYGDEWSNTTIYFNNFSRANQGDVTVLASSLGPIFTNLWQVEPSLFLAAMFFSDFICYIDRGSLILIIWVEIIPTTFRQIVQRFYYTCTWYTVKNFHTPWRPWFSPLK